MRRRATILFAIAAAALVAASAPASAATAQLVRTTEEDFREGTLSGVSVSGSGDDATVDYRSETIDDFEDTGLGEYSGDTGNFSVASGNGVTSGSTALQATSSGVSIITSSPGDGLPHYPSAGDVMTYQSTLGDGGMARPEQITGFGVQPSGSGTFADGYYVQLDAEDGRLVLFKDTPSNVLDSESVSLPADPVNVSVVWTTSGSITVTVSDGGTPFATVSASDTEYASGGTSFAVGGSSTAPAWVDNVRVGESTGTFVGDAFAAQANEGWVNFTEFSGARANVTWQGSDGEGGPWTDVSTDTYQAAANYSTDLGASGYDYYRVVIEFRAIPGAGTPTASLGETSVFVQAQPPNATDPSPVDGYEPGGSSVEFGVQINDSDFDTPRGDTVNATLVLGGVAEETIEVNENTTVNTTLNLEQNTSEEWYWYVEDSYGLTDTTETRNISVPEAIQIRSSQVPHELLNNSTFRVRVFDLDSDAVEEHYTSNATVSLSEIDIDTPYVVTVSGSENYTTRTVLVDNALDQNTIYLLPTDGPTANIIFELDDRTGRFPPGETRLYVEAPINRDYNNDGELETRYQVIAGDSFGGSERFSTVLSTAERYRLRIVNQEGETRVLGAFEPAGDERVVLPIGQVSIGGVDTNASTFSDARLRTVDGEEQIRIVYRDQTEDTDSLLVSVYNENGTLVYGPDPSLGPYGSYVATVPLGETTANQYSVYINGSRNGEEFTREITIGGVDDIATEWPINDQVLSIIGAILTIAITGIVVIHDARASAIAGVCVATLFSLMGVFAIDPLFLSFAGGLAILGNLGRFRL